MNQHWIAAWGCPTTRPTRRNAEWMKDTTVRMNLYMTVSGTALRFRFSNFYGTEDAEITRASVSVVADKSTCDADRLTTITFDGKESAVMAPGAELVSDEIDFAFAAGESLAVSLYFGNFTKMSTAFGISDTFIFNWVSAGDQTHAAAFPVTENMTADAFPFLHTVDALCDEKCYSIVAFGDSITAQTWPDRLARRLSELGRDDVAVVRKAIGGSRILRDYPCTALQTYGLNGVERFRREVLQAGVKKVFILHGINDIIHPDGSYFRPWSHQPTAEEMIAGLQTYIDFAHEHGIEVYLSAILPFKGWRTYSEEKDALRMAVNDWIYHHAEVEGILPFEQTVMDPADPLQMQQQYDSGDHLHPRSLGAQAMADSIPEEML